MTMMTRKIILEYCSTAVLPLSSSAHYVATESRFLTSQHPVRRPSLPVVQSLLVIGYYRSCPVVDVVTWWRVYFHHAGRYGVTRPDSGWYLCREQLETE